MADQTKAGESESWRFYLPSLPVLETWLLQHRPFLYLATDLNNREEIQLNQKSETNKYGSNCIARTEKQYFWCPSDWIEADYMGLNAVWQLHRARWRFGSKEASAMPPSYL